MIPKSSLNGIVRVVNDFHELKGCRIVLYGNEKCSVLAEGVVPSANFANILVMVEELGISDPLTNEDTARWSNAPGGSPPGSPNPQVITNKSRLAAELTGMGISCGLTVVSAGLVVAGGAFTLPTGGAAIALFVAGWAGLVANAVQCGNAIARSMEAANHPDDDSLSRLDSDDKYQVASLIVDGIGVVSAVASLPSGVKSLMQLVKSRMALRGLTETGFKGTTRPERVKIVGELIEEISRTPEGKLVAEKAMREAKLTPRALQPGGVVTKGAAKTALKIISDDTLRRLEVALAGVVSAASGPGVSAMKSEWVGSASGSVNWIIHVLDGSP